MNRSFIFVASSVLGLSTLAVSRDAHALGPVDLEAGAKVGYATSPVSGGGTNPLGFGVGGRAGLAFLGGSTNVPAPNGGVVTSAGSVSVSTNTLMYGGELGYGIKILDLLTIRPQVGLGNATFSVSGGGQSASSSYYYLEPGVTGLIGLGLLYVGADANVLVLPSLPSSQAAFTLHAQIGVKF